MADYLDTLSNISESGEECIIADIENEDEGSKIIICEPCSEDGIEFPAKGYCVDCEEYLCETCYSHHLTPRPFRHHVLQEGNEMPREKTKYMSRGLSVARCGFHPEKKITSYCRSHDQLCCESCVLIGHQVCHDISSIETLGIDIENNSEFKTFYTKLLNMEQQYNEKQRVAVSNLEIVDKYYTDALQCFKKKLDEIKMKDVEKVSVVKNVYDSASRQTNQWVADMERYWLNREFGQLFTLVKMTGSHLDMVDNNVRLLCQDNTVTRYRFTEEESATDVNELGKLETVSYSIDKINVKHPKENFNCIVRDMALLNNDLILVADYGSNCSLKLINIQTNTVVSAIELSSGPWQMTVTDNKEAYVSIPGTRKLLHLRTPTTDVSNIREINIDEQCSALEFYNNMLNVQCIGPCKLLEMDLDGRVQRHIHEDVSSVTEFTGERYVTHPYCSVVNKSTGSVIVSCYNQNSITEITQDGNVRLLMKSEFLRSPFGLCMDNDGSLLVCSCAGKCVLRVTSLGAIQDVLPEPLDFTPSAIALDAENRKLYVGGNHDQIYVYDV